MYVTYKNNNNVCPRPASTARPKNYEIGIWHFFCFVLFCFVLKKPNLLSDMGLYQCAHCKIGVCHAFIELFEFKTLTTSYSTVLWVSSCIKCALRIVHRGFLNNVYIFSSPSSNDLKTKRKLFPNYYFKKSLCSFQYNWLLQVLQSPRFKNFE